MADARHHQKAKAAPLADGPLAIRGERRSRGATLVKPTLPGAQDIGFARCGYGLTGDSGQPIPSARITVATPARATGGVHTLALAAPRPIHRALPRPLCSFRGLSGRRPFGYSSGSWLLCAHDSTGIADCQRGGRRRRRLDCAHPVAGRRPGWTLRCAGPTSIGKRGCPADVQAGSRAALASPTEPCADGRGTTDPAHPWHRRASHASTRSRQARQRVGSLF